MMQTTPLTIKDALAVVAVIFAHASKCDGTTTIKLRDPITEVVTKLKEPCKVCAVNREKIQSLPPQILSVALSESEPIRASFQLATLVVDSTLERRGHNGKRAERDVEAGMKLLRYWRDECGGKLRD